ncbi:Uncharacterized protein PBTT_04194 [Plasmodiophora brassicae]
MYDVLFLLAVLGIARLSGAATYKLTTRSTTYALSGAVPLIPGLSYQSTTYAVRYTTDVLGALNVEQRNGWAVSCTIDIAKACRVRPDRLVCATYLWDPPDSAIVFFDLLPTATGNATDVAKFTETLQAQIRLKNGILQNAGVAPGQTVVPVPSSVNVCRDGTLVDGQSPCPSPEAAASDTPQISPTVIYVIGFTLVFTILAVLVVLILRWKWLLDEMRRARPQMQMQPASLAINSMNIRDPATRADHNTTLNTRTTTTTTATTTTMGTKSTMGTGTTFSTLTSFLGLSGSQGIVSSPFKKNIAAVSPSEAPAKRKFMKNTTG